MSIEIIASSPVAFPHAQIAQAAHSAGFKGMVAFEHASIADVTSAVSSLLKTGTPFIASVADFGEAEQALLEPAFAAGLASILITSLSDRTAEQATAIRSFGADVWFEVTSLDQLALVLPLEPSALVVKGGEAGGRVSGAATAELVRQVAEKTALRLYARGGVDLYSAAGLIAAGARGLVVDWQLALAEESPLPEALRARIAHLQPSDLISLQDKNGTLQLCPAGTEELAPALKDSSADGWPAAFDQAVAAHQVLLLGPGALAAAPLARLSRTVKGICAILRREAGRQVRVASRLITKESASFVSRDLKTELPLLVQVQAEPAVAAEILQTLQRRAAGILPVAAFRSEVAQAVIQGTPEVAAAVEVKPSEDAEAAGLKASKALFALVGESDVPKQFEAAGLDAFLALSDENGIDAALKSGVARVVAGIAAESPSAVWGGAVRAFLRFLHTRPVTFKAESLTLVLGGVNASAAGIAQAYAVIAPLAERGVTIGFLVPASTVAEAQAALTAMEGAAAQLEKVASVLVQDGLRGKNAQYKANDVAIVGVSCMLPKAADLAEYWHNVNTKRSVITEVPKGRWDQDVYFDEDRRARDKIYSKWGGFLDDVIFDPVKFGMPPNSLSSIEPLQLVTLEMVRRALEDAGYMDRRYNKEETACIVGTGGGVGELGLAYGFRTMVPHYMDKAGGTSADAKHLIDTLAADLPEWTEDSFAGLLLNVVSGRVTNRFDFGGTNFIVDAACATSLAALRHSVTELQNGTSEMVVTAACDTMQSAFGYMCFAKTQALSPTGVPRTFDEKADGIVISEGFAVTILKRLEDALLDGDKIYAVIKSVGASSDGKDKGLTAPRPIGQMRALDRAYKQAGIDPRTVGLIEAHGTGTAVGDRTEAESLVSYFGKVGADKHSIALGSVKSMIGHTKCAAGMAGLMKAAMAVRHKVLPPTANVTQPNSKVDFKNGALYLNTEARPWLQRLDGAPRRAGVSAFGFGGTNFHAVLEEYRPAEGFLEEDLPLRDWPAELFLMRGESADSLLETVDGLRTALREGAKPLMVDLAAAVYWEKGRGEGSHCLAIVAGTLEELDHRLELARAAVQSGQEFRDPRGVYYTPKPAMAGTKVAFAFPGQGSQRVDMMIDLALAFPLVRETLEESDAALGMQLGQPLSQYIYPVPVFNDADKQANETALKQTNVAQPALGAADMAMFRLLQHLDIHPDAACGHSYGEFAALAAAGVMSVEELIKISELRGRVIVESAKEELGTMAAVDAPEQQVLAGIADIDGVWIANLNSPMQTVVSGTQKGVEEAIKRFMSKGVNARTIPVACAFHSELVAGAKEPLRKGLEQCDLKAPRFDVYSNTTVEPHGADPAKMRDTLVEHLARPVRFADEILKMYEAGVRVFIESGPGKVLTGLVSRTLGDRPHVAINMDQPGRHGLMHLPHALAQIAVAGVPFFAYRLFEGRVSKPIELSRLVADTKPAAIPATAWLISDGKAVPVSQANKKQEKKSAMGDQERLDPSQPRLFNAAPGAAPGPVAPAPAPVPVAMAAPPPAPMPPSQPVSQPMMAPPAPAYAAAPAAMPPAVVAPAPMAYPAAPARPVAPYADPYGFRPAASSLEMAVQGHHRLMSRFLDTHRSILMAMLRPGSAAMTEPMYAEPQYAPAPAAPMYAPPQAYAPAPAAPMYAPPAPAYAPPAPAYAPPAPAAYAAPAPVYAAPAPAPVPQYAPAPAPAPVAPPPAVTVTVAPPAPAPAPPAPVAAAPAPAPAPVVTVSVTPAPAPAAPAAPARVSREEITAKLLDLVSQRTGYPTDMLGLDLDLEADLGVDSIKRVEIFGALQNESILPGAAVEGQIETLSKMKTLRAIIDWVDSQAEQLAGGASAAPAAPAAIAPGEAPATRMLVEVSEAKQAQNPNLPRPTGVILTDDGRGVARLIADKLTSLGVRHTLVAHQPGSGVNFQDPASVAKAAEALRAELGSVSHLLHLMPLATVTAEEAAEFEQRCDRDLKAVYLLSKAFEADFKKAASAGVVAAVQLGGSFGFGPESTKDFFPGTGAISGFVKTLSREWPGTVLAKTVDFELDASVEFMAERIFTEMLTGDGRTEIGYQSGKRKTVSTVPVPVEGGRSALKLDRESVILITGGARGITADIAIEIAEAFQSKLVLVGRSPLPPETEPEDIAGVENDRQLKAALLDRINSIGQRATPALVEGEFRKIKAQREIRAKLALMRKAGSVIDYFSADVCDSANFASVIGKIYEKYGRIDGVIHGAGVIEDKLVGDKTPESFDRVVKPKVTGALTLARALRPDGVQFMVFFSSVSGRYGNRGQCDYSAANEVLNKLAQSLNARWPGRITALNWGPWRTEGGMVSNELAERFAKAGIEMISVPAGRKAFLLELLHGRKEDAEVVFGGPLTPDQQNPTLAGNAAKPKGNPAALAMLNAGEAKVEGSETSVEVEIGPETHPFLLDHQLDGTPVMPFTGVLDLLAETGILAAGVTPVTAVKSMTMAKGIQFDGGLPKKVYLKAAPQADGSVDVSLKLDPSAPITNYKAKTLFGGAPQPAPGKLALKDAKPLPLSLGDAYDQWLFHGPAFACIKSVEAVGTNGIIATMRPSRPRDLIRSAPVSSWTIDPIVCDGSLQLTILWARTYLNATPLPARLGAYHFHAPMASAAEIRCEAEIHNPPGSPLLSCNIRFYSETGRLLGWMEGMELNVSPALNRLAKSQASVTAKS